MHQRIPINLEIKSYIISLKSIYIDEWGLTKSIIKKIKDIVFTKYYLL
jgi:hypothetical protein